MDGSTASNLYRRLARGYRMDRRFGAIYDTAPAGSEDLTCIRGINTREAVVLNRFGVYFLEQIALWQDRELVAFAEELGMRPSVVRGEQWIEQAQVWTQTDEQHGAAQVHDRPAPVIRTVSLLACALLIGFLFVYGLSLHDSPPIRGTLSADITSLRVPTDSRLLISHIRPGDEVFSGDSLLTLEKTEHLTMISRQQQRVRLLQRDLQKAEAQASLDLEWRTRELDRELSDVRARAQLIQEVNREPIDRVRSASTAPTSEPQLSTTIPVSNSRTIPDRPHTNRSPNAMVFISGASGETSLGIATETPPPQPEPEEPAATRAPAPTNVVLASEPIAVKTVLSVESRTVEMRLQRLEELRAALPEQVRRAAGVEGMRIQLGAETERLNQMQTISREVAVVCPAYGKIGQVRYKAGDLMSSGEVMVKILHTDQRYVMAYVPTSRLNEICPGTPVDVIFPGRQRYHGKVANLPMLAESTGQGGQSFSTVRIEPVGKLWPEIPVGSQIDVVVGDKGRML